MFKKTNRRTVFVRLAALLLLSLLLSGTASVLMPALPGPLTAYAGEWKEDYYRASDTLGENGLSDAQTESLDETCITFMKDFHADLSLLAVKTDDLEGGTLSDLARGYYDDCGFGWGENRDGFQMVWNVDTDEILIEAYGAAVDMVPADTLRWIEKTALPYKEEYGLFGPMYATARLLRIHLEKNSGAGTASEAVGAEAADEGVDAEAANDGAGAQADVDSAGGVDLPEDVDPVEGVDLPESVDPAQGVDLPESVDPAQGVDLSARVGEGAAMPAWYPVYPEDFPKYHDETAPRVVDTADLFTADQEDVMEARLAQLREELSKDIVIFTDISTYGLERKIYAADFYDFNGYGIGDEYEGVILFICMDPEDRGWWACCTGPETMGLYTETIANEIDDLLYEYMVNGQYYEGVSDWIENFRRLYLTGSPYTPDWAMAAAAEDGAKGRAPDPDAPRIVDDAKLLTEEERALLTEQADQLSQKYNLDIVVYTALSAGSMERQAFSDLFYSYNGYGYGDARDGILLTIFKRPYYSPSLCMTASGSGKNRLTSVNESRLLDRCESLLDAGAYYKGISQWMDHTDHMLRTGRVPRSFGFWIFAVILSALAGTIWGIFSLVKAEERMDTPAIKKDAADYLIRGSLRVNKVRDEFLHMRKTSAYIPPEDKSSDSGSSSGGRSSYSGSYKGSSGTKHSGSGRNF